MFYDSRTYFNSPPIRQFAELKGIALTFAPLGASKLVSMIEKANDLL